MNGEKTMPEGVLERLQGYAERIEKKIGEAVNDYLKWVEQEFAVTDWQDEDDDLLIEWAEMFVLETRNLGGSSSGRQTQTFVGQFVGIDDSINDLRASIRDRAVSAYRNNSSQAIDNGLVGVVKAKDGVWHINGEPTKETVNGQDLPWFGLKVDGDIICILNEKGGPIAPESKARNLYLLGNSQDKFNSNITVLRIQLSGDNMTEKYELGRPVICQCITPNKEEYDTVYTNRDFSKTLVYDDSFVDDEDKPYLRPEKFLINNDTYAEISELDEIYEQRKILSRNGNYYGPTIITKGYVSRLSLEATPNDYDQTGRNFRLNVTSPSLQKAYGRDSVKSEVTIWIPGRIYDDSNPFEFKDSYGEWQPYAEKTPIIIFGRLKMSVYNDQTTPNITALGIYVPTRTARPGAKGGDTNLEQFRRDE